MQTILGSDGVIGRELSRSLSASTDRIRQVSAAPARSTRATKPLQRTFWTPRRRREPSPAARAKYGPGAVQSFPHVTVFERLRAGKTPQWVGNARALHTFTYTPDAGRAVALLGQSAQAWGQTWRLPTSRETMPGQTFVRLACELSVRIEAACGIAATAYRDGIRTCLAGDGST